MINLSLRALLIQKSIKLRTLYLHTGSGFESFVNSEEYQTNAVDTKRPHTFESFVNSEEYQTY